MLAWTRFVSPVFSWEISHFHQSVCGSAMNPGRNYFILTTNEIDITLKRERERAEMKTSIKRWLLDSLCFESRS